MSRSVPAAILTALSQPEVKPFYAVEFQFDDTDGTRFDQAGYAGDRAVRFWTGYGDREIEGNTYLGAGNLISISGLEEVSDMSAKGAIVSMNGIPGSLISLALQEPFQHRKCRILFGAETIPVDGWILSSGFWDDTSIWDDTAIWRDDGSVVYNTVEVFSGYIDKMPIQDGAETGTVTASLESKWVRLNKPVIRRYTSESQKSRYPTDTFFDWVADLQDKDTLWGRSNA